MGIAAALVILAVVLVDRGRTSFANLLNLSVNLTNK